MATALIVPGSHWMKLAQAEAPPVPRRPPPMPDQRRVGSDDWQGWGNHILQTLQSQTEALQELRKEVEDLRVDNAMIKTKIAYFSAAAGALGAVLATVVKNLIFH